MEIMKNYINKPSNFLHNFLYIVLKNIPQEIKNSLYPNEQNYTNNKIKQFSKTNIIYYKNIN
jgi:hypothetical protein